MTRGLTWLDWVILVLVSGFALRGLMRGTLGQIVGFMGLVAGLWTASWLAQWVGQHWDSARPAVVFWALRWLVAVLGGLGVAALFEAMGHRVREAVDATPAKWLDRIGGLVVGGATGLLLAALVAVVVVLTSVPVEGSTGAPGRLVPPTLAGAARACALARGYFPGSEWLERRIEAAAARIKAPDTIT